MHAVHSPVAVCSAARQYQSPQFAPIVQNKPTGAAVCAWDVLGLRPDDRPCLRAHASRGAHLSIQGGARNRLSVAVAGYCRRDCTATVGPSLVLIAHTHCRTSVGLSSVGLSSVGLSSAGLSTVGLSSVYLSSAGLSMLA